MMDEIECFTAGAAICCAVAAGTSVQMFGVNCWTIAVGAKSKGGHTLMVRIKLRRKANGLGKAINKNTQDHRKAITITNATRVFIVAQSGDVRRHHSVHNALD